MTTDIATLAIKIDSQQARIAALELEKLEKSGLKAETATGRLTNSIGGLTTVVTGLMGAFGAYKLGQYVTDATMMAARFETLGVVMHTVGKNAGYSATEMDYFDQQLRKTGISMNESRTVLARMTQAHLDLTKSSELARIAQDAAVIGNINSSEAFERMVIGIQTAQVEILRNIGINVQFEQGYKELAKTLGKTVNELTEEEKATSRLNQVMGAGADISGVYAAAMGTVGKQISSLKRYTDDFKVELGQAFGPSAQVLVKTYAETLKGLSAELKELKETGALDKWAMGMARGVISSVELMVDGFGLLYNSIASVRLTFGVLAEKAADFFEGQSDIRLRGNFLVKGLYEELEEAESRLATVTKNFEKGYTNATQRAVHQQQKIVDEIKKQIDAEEEAVDWYENMRLAGIEMAKTNATALDENAKKIDEVKDRLRGLQEELEKQAELQKLLKTAAEDTYANLDYGKPADGLDSVTTATVKLTKETIKAQKALDSLKDELNAIQMSGYGAGIAGINREFDKLVEKAIAAYGPTKELQQVLEQIEFGRALAIADEDANLITDSHQDAADKVTNIWTTALEGLSMSLAHWVTEGGDLMNALEGSLRNVASENLQGVFKGVLGSSQFGAASSMAFPLMAGAGGSGDYTAAGLSALYAYNNPDAFFAGMMNTQSAVSNTLSGMGAGGVASSVTNLSPASWGGLQTAAIDFAIALLSGKDIAQAGGHALTAASGFMAGASVGGPWGGVVGAILAGLGFDMAIGGENPRGILLSDYVNNGKIGAGQNSYTPGSGLGSLNTFSEADILSMFSAQHPSYTVVGMTEEEDTTITPNLDASLLHTSLTNAYITGRNVVADDFNSFIETTIAKLPEGLVGFYEDMLSQADFSFDVPEGQYFHIDDFENGLRTVLGNYYDKLMATASEGMINALNLWLDTDTITEDLGLDIFTSGAQSNIKDFVGNAISQLESGNWDAGVEQLTEALNYVDNAGQILAGWQNIIDEQTLSGTELQLKRLDLWYEKELASAKLLGLETGLLTEAYNLQKDAINEVVVEIKDFSKEVKTIEGLYTELNDATSDYEVTMSSLNNIMYDGIDSIESFTDSMLEWLKHMVQMRQGYENLSDKIVGNQSIINKNLAVAQTNEWSWVQGQIHSLGNDYNSQSPEDQLGTLEELNSLVMRRYELEYEGLQELINQAQTMRDLSIQINDKMRGLNYSQYNLATPAQKAVQAQGDYETLLAGAQSGDTVAIQKYLDFTETFLQASMDTNKSSQRYFDDFAMVQSDLAALGDLTDQAATLEQYYLSQLKDLTDKTNTTLAALLESSEKATIDIVNAIQTQGSRTDIQGAIKGYLINKSAGRDEDPRLRTAESKTEVNVYLDSEQIAAKVRVRDNDARARGFVRRSPV